jgi:hypothetical protein
MYPDDVDDVDILFARLQPADPPENMSERVIARTQARVRRRHAIGYALLAASVVFAIGLSFIVGQQLKISGALALVDFIADMELLTAAPLEVALAVLELVPWHLAALVAASLALVVVAVRLALSPSVRFGSRPAGR